MPDINIGAHYKVRILVVEDDKDMAMLNARMLRRHGFDTMTAYSAAEAREIVSANDIDMFILDITLPDGDGLSLCAEFRRKTDVPVLFLTGKKESSDKVTGLNVGGDYYLTKPYDSNELLAVVKSLLRRSEQFVEKVSAASYVRRGPITIKLAESKAFINDRDAELTQKELTLLTLLVQNENRELSYNEIYKRVWGSDINNDSAALRTTVSRLKKKLEEESSEEFSIRNEQKRGYKFTCYI